MFGKTVALFCVVVAAGCGTNAQSPKLGGCPDASAMTNFEPAKYLGRWYQFARSGSIFELGGACSTADYLATDVDGQITVSNTMRQPFLFNNQVQRNGTGILESSDDGAAKFQVEFDTSFGIKAPLWVLGTDYDNYAVAWTCINLGLARFESSWLLTRDYNPTDSVLTQAYAVYDKNNLSRSSLTNTTQAGCWE